MDKSQLESLEPPVSQEEIETASTQQAEQKVEAPKQEPVVEQEKVEKVVPLAALHEARQQKKELQAEMQRMRDEQARRDQILEQRFAAMQQAREQVQIPKYDDAPLEHLKGGLDAMQANLQQLNANTQQHTQHVQRQQYEQHVASLAAAAEVDFVKTSPDYAEALNHIRSFRVAQLEAMGYAGAQIGQIVKHEAFGVVEKALHEGRNPAEVIYKMAEAAGYKAKQQQQDPAQKLETLKKGQEAAKTLSGGGATGGKPTIEQIANMSEQEFADFMKDGGEKILKSYSK